MMRTVFALLVLAARIIALDGWMDDNMHVSGGVAWDGGMIGIGVYSVGWRRVRAIEFN